MHIRPDTELSDLLGEIGSYERHQVEIAFPHDLEIGTLHEPGKDHKLVGSMIEGFSYWESDLSWQEGWQFVLQEQIGQRYGSLVSTQKSILLPNLPYDEATSEGLPAAFNEEFGHHISEAVQNAFRHGNKKDLTRKIPITSYLGKYGIVYMVENEGEGFDVKATLSKFRARSVDWHHDESFGAGISTWDAAIELNLRSGKPDGSIVEPGYFFAFNPKGNQWMMIYKFAEARYKPKGYGQHAKKKKGLLIFDLEGTLANLWVSGIFMYEGIPIADVMYVRPGAVDALKELQRSYNIALATKLSDSGRLNATVCYFIEQGVEFDAVFSGNRLGNSKDYKDYRDVYSRFNIADRDIEKKVLVIGDIRMSLDQISEQSLRKKDYEEGLSASDIPISINSYAPAVLLFPHPFLEEGSSIDGTRNFSAVSMETLPALVNGLYRAGDQDFMKGFGTFRKQGILKYETMPARWMDSAKLLVNHAAGPLRPYEQVTISAEATIPL